MSLLPTDRAEGVPAHARSLKDILFLYNSSTPSPSSNNTTNNNNNTNNNGNNSSTNNNTNLFNESDDESEIEMLEEHLVYLNAAILSSERRYLLYFYLHCLDYIRHCFILFVII